MVCDNRNYKVVVMYSTVLQLNKIMKTRPAKIDPTWKSDSNPSKKFGFEYDFLDPNPKKIELEKLAN